MFAKIKELLIIKRINDILDLIEIEKKKKMDEALEVVKNNPDIKELPQLLQPQYHFGYESDYRSFIQMMISYERTNEEIVNSIMKILDDKVETGISLHKISMKHNL